jgi:hypothetical protein
MLGRQPFGPWLLAPAALGLASYGIYELLIAWRGRFLTTFVSRGRRFKSSHPDYTSPQKTMSSAPST